MDNAPSITINDLPAEWQQKLRSDLLDLKRSGVDPDTAQKYVGAYLEGFARPSLLGSAMQGTLSNFGDEARGLARSILKGSNRIIETARARGSIDGARQQTPKAAMAAGVAGSLAPLAVGLPFAKAPSPLAAPEGALPAAMKGGAVGAGVGGVMGAIAGAGDAVGGLRERMAGAAEGATGGAMFGGGIGLLAGPAVKLGQSLGRRIYSALAPRGGLPDAERNMARALAESGMTADQVADRVRTARASGVPMVAADAMGDAGRDAMAYAVQAPGPGAARAKQVIGDRQMAQPGRLRDAAARITGVNEGAASEALAAKAAGRPGTDAAYRALDGIELPPAAADELRRRLAGPEFQAAYRDASNDIRLALSNGEAPRAMPPLQAFMDGSANLTAREADTILQAVDAAARAGRTPSAFLPGASEVTGGPTGSRSLGVSFEQARDALVREVPEVGAARAAAKRTLDMTGGLELGEKLMAPSVTVDEVRATLAKATPEEAEGIRRGFSSAIKAKLESFGRGPSADATRVILGSEGMEAKIRLMLPQDQADEILRIAGMETDLSRTAKVPFNSKTFFNMENAKANEGGSAGGGFSLRGLAELVMGDLNEGARRRAREEMAGIGLLDDPRDIARILGRAQRRSPGTVPGVQSGAASGVLGGTIEGRRLEDRR